MRSVALAEWSSRAVGGKLPARDSGPRDCAQRAPSPSVDWRLRELLSRRSHSRFAREGHAKPTASRAEASSRCERDFASAPGWPTPSLLLAGSGVAHSAPIPIPCSGGGSRRERQWHGAAKTPISVWTAVVQSVFAETSPLALKP